MSLKEKRTRKPRRVKKIESDYEHPGPERSLRSRRREYDLDSGRGPRNGYETYNFYEDRYNGWQDIYRPDYRRDYDMYDDYGMNDYSYRYNPRGYNNGYDDPYYDNLDTGEDCRTCSRRGMRGRRMYDDSQYLYRYAEDSPGFRYGNYRDSEYSHMDSGFSHMDSGYSYTNSREKPNRRPRKQIQREPELDVYAMPNISGQKGFKYNYKNKERRTSEVLSESESDSTSHRGNHTRRKVKKKIREHG